MAIEKTLVVDQITVVEGGSVLYREATRLVEDGTILSQTFHRNTLVPGQSLDAVPEEVQKICRVVWTPEIIEAYRAAQPVVQE